MKEVPKREREARTEDMMKQIQKIFRERGSVALEMARKEILKEEIECTEAREALAYFMTQYLQDVTRPAFMSLICEAVGGNPAATTAMAVPMVLINGAIDLHDDVIDRSKTKMGRPTVLGKFGKDIALLVGDALLFKGFELLNKVGRGMSAQKANAIMSNVKDMFFELGDSEALELQFRGRLDITPKEYLNVVRKRASNVEVHARISAIICNCTEREVEALGKFSRTLGVLFVMRDDYIDALDPVELRHRAKYESLPLPLIYALQNPETKKEILQVLTKTEVTRRDIDALIDTILSSGGFGEVKKKMQLLVKAGQSHLNSIKVQGRDLNLIMSSTLEGL